MVSDGSWPTLSWEERTWHPAMDPDTVSRRVRERHSGLYRAAVPPAIAALDVGMPGEVLSLAEDATIAIARFDAELGSDIAPFGSVLLRSESASSSRIENLTSGARAIAVAEIEQVGRSNAVQIVANVHAMQAAVMLADRLDLNAMLAMHAALMEHDARHEAGILRRQQVWIGGSHFGPHLADFVPPHHTHVPGAMADLVSFIGRDDVPILVQAAIAHAQFETIHPFTDGNGRTGRALIHAILRGSGLTRNITVPVSSGLLTDTAGYFSALTRYREGDPSEIVRCMAEAIFHAISNGRQLIADLEQIRARWHSVIHARQDSATWRLADRLLRQPVINSEIATEATGTTSANAHIAIRRLAEAGIIREFTGRHRERLWQAPEVLASLDDFAARAGRRS